MKSSESSNQSNSCFDLKQIIKTFIKYKIYIVLPIGLYSILLFVTIIGVFSTLRDYPISEICFSNTCLASLNSNFGNIIKMHLAGAEYILWITTSLSVTIAIYSYIVTSNASMASSNTANLNEFRSIVVHSLNRNLKEQNINILMLYKYIYEDSDEGLINPSEKYIDHLKKINETIVNYSSHGANLNFQSHANKIIQLFSPLGIAIKNRGRNYFFEDELSVVRFLNEINKLILFERPFRIKERSIR